MEMDVIDGVRKFRIRWHGYGPDDDTWEPHGHLPPAEVKSFLQENDLYDYSWSTEARCKYCDVKCKNGNSQRCTATGQS